MSDPGDVDLDELFPFDEYRPMQRDTLEAAHRELQGDRFDNIIVDAPTGIGKSPLNVALCRTEDSAFYTTPQKKLREQLENDETLSQHYQVLKARRDYKCGATGENCKECSINLDPSIQCSEMDRCTYWNAKETAMNADIAVTTFAYLILDRELPAQSQNENGATTRISFRDQRDIIVVDECHSLASQVANLHAGFEIGPWTLPPEVFQNETANRDYSNVERHQQVEGLVERMHDRVKRFLAEHGNDEKRHYDLKLCKEFMRKHNWFSTETETMDRQWVVETQEVMDRDKNNEIQKVIIKPVKVDNFLRRYVWSRGENRILSTATAPYRGNTEKWCYELGLDPDRTKFLRVGMPIDADRRQIHTDTIIDTFSSGGDDDNWAEIMSSLNDLAGKHEGEKGLVHTASYSRARRVQETVNEDESRYPNLTGNIMLHRGDRGASDDVFVSDWQRSEKDIALSPSMAEGVDLVGDQCRWQVLLKVPYPFMGGARVKYLTQEENRWDWYYEMTAVRTIQSAGRAVRGLDDYADYYVLDGSFNSLRNRVEFPPWYTEAIVS